MGEIAEYWEDLAFSQMAEESIKAEKILEYYENSTLFWTTKDDKSILIHNMTDIHVKNTLNLLLKVEEKTEITKAYIEVFEQEINKRKI